MDIVKINKNMGILSYWKFENVVKGYKVDLMANKKSMICLDRDEIIIIIDGPYRIRDGYENNDFFDVSLAYRLKTGKKIYIHLPQSKNIFDNGFYFNEL